MLCLSVTCCPGIKDSWISGQDRFHINVMNRPGQPLVISCHLESSHTYNVVHQCRMYEEWLVCIYIHCWWHHGVERSGSVQLSVSLNFDRKRSLSDSILAYMLTISMFNSCLQRIKWLKSFSLNMGRYRYLFCYQYLPQSWQHSGKTLMKSSNLWGSELHGMASWSQEIGPTASCQYAP